jgi:signal peptidase I
MLNHIMKKIRRASFTVVQQSMHPTLRHGDKLIAFKRRDPIPLKRGNIVLVKRENQTPPQSIKRIIGLPTEDLSISAGRVWINGQVLEKLKITFEPLIKFGPVKIPPAHYFLIGDNVNDSEDSRDFGPVPLDDITHKAIAVYYPPHHFKFLV